MPGMSNNWQHMTLLPVPRPAGVAHGLGPGTAQGRPKRTTVPERNAHPPGSDPSASRGEFWRSLSVAERGVLRRAARSRTFPAKSPLCHQGDESDHIIIVEDGWAKVTSSTEDGHEVVLAVRGPGDLVCESAVLGSRERSATVTALSEIQGLVVPAIRFTAFLDEHPRTWRLVTGIFVQRIDEGDRRVQAHASASGAQRLALLLLELAELSRPHSPPAADGSITIRPPLSQEELGSWVDASRETVARALKSWRRRGLVRTGWRQITVLDRAALHAYAHGRNL
jgi:CRP/FNR family cyclic AMP-dependent transcriptional regulator